MTTPIEKALEWIELAQAGAEVGIADPAMRIAVLQNLTQAIELLQPPASGNPASEAKDSAATDGAVEPIGWTWTYFGDRHFTVNKPDFSHVQNLPNVPEAVPVYLAPSTPSSSWVEEAVKALEFVSVAYGEFSEELIEACEEIFFFRSYKYLGDCIDRAEECLAKLQGAR